MRKTTDPAAPDTLSDPAPVRSALRRFADPRSLRWKVAAAACAMALGIGILVHQTTQNRSLGIARAGAVEDLGKAETAFRAGQPPQSHPATGAYYRMGDEVPDELRDRIGSGAGPVIWYDTRHPLRGYAMWAGSRVNGTLLAVSVD
ncbi:hypothetical protein O3W51_03735, partial [Streptomyces sp. H39-C1]|nr:hypothetical protein [Streptomyces sp. H39-C1]